MAYEFPADVAELIQEQMSGSGYRSEDEVLRDALQVLRALKSRQEELLADVAVGVEQADRGQAGPLDLNVVLERWSQRLAAEGIHD